MQEIPPCLVPYDLDDEDPGDPDVRVSQQQRDRMVMNEAEFFDDDMDNDQDDLDEI